MTVDGHVEDGHIVLDAPVPLQEGMKVRVEIVASEAIEKPAQNEAELPSLYERMKPFIGSVKGLPADFAINHDHYLHGQPKRQ